MPLLTTGAGTFPVISSVSVIKSIQTGTISFGTTDSTKTATITSVNTANSIVLWNGENNNRTSSTGYERFAIRISLTNGTTVTGDRDTASTNTVAVAFTVVEFNSGVNSIQSGTIAITATNTSNTASISAVGANAFVLFQGLSVAGPSGLNRANILGSVVLTNTTTVTANCLANATNTTTIGYTVVDLDTTVVSAVQPRNFNSIAVATTDVDTITSVTPAQTLLFYNGLIGTTTNGVDTMDFHQVLTNSTTVTETRSAPTAAIRTHYYTAVTFASAAVKSLQRGTITLSAATSNTATITSVATTKAFLNWGNFLTVTANAQVAQPTTVLTNATTVTTTLNAAGSITTAYEVIEFN